MFWEPQNSSLHHKGGEFLFPTVAESECTNYKQYVELQACMNKPGERVENCPLKGFASCQSLTRRNSLWPSYEVLKLMARKTNRKLAEYIRESTLNGKIVRRNNTEMRP